MRSNLPRHDEWPNLHNLDTTDDKLARAAVEIKRTADGRTCGDCEHFRQTYCDKHASSLTGNNLAVLFPDGDRMHGVLGCGGARVRGDYDRLERHDEWPSFDDVKPRFPDGEPHPTSRTRIILALAFIIGALLVKACVPADAAPDTAALVD